MAISGSEAAKRLEDVRTQIRKSASRFDSPDRTVELVAVSKSFPAEAIRVFLEAGQRRFGENRVQEAKQKWPELRRDFPDIQLHLIGPLQSNKVRDAVGLFDVIESVDREKIARALAGEMVRAGKQLGVFIQVNIGEEAQKAGVSPGDTLSLVRLCRDVLAMDVRGLMCIPPQGAAPGPYFARLAFLAREAGLDGLSMGMSGDYPVGIEMGATHVRVGSALFGERG